MATDKAPNVSSMPHSESINIDTLRQLFQQFAADLVGKKGSTAGSTESHVNPELIEVLRKITQHLGESKSSKKTTSSYDSYDFGLEKSLESLSKSVKNTIDKLQDIKGLSKDEIKGKGPISKLENELKNIENLKTTMEKSSGIGNQAIESELKNRYEILDILVYQEKSLINQISQTKQYDELWKKHGDRLVEITKQKKAQSEYMDYMAKKAEILSDEEYNLWQRLALKRTEYLLKSNKIEESEANKKLNQLLKMNEIRKAGASFISSALGVLSWGQMINNALQYGKEIQNIGGALGGFRNQNREITNQLDEQGRSVIRLSKGMFGLADATQAINSLYQIGISDLSQSSKILDQSAQNAAEMNMQLADVVGHAGEMNFNLKLSGNQSAAILKSTSNLTRELGFSGQKVIGIQKGLEQTFTTLRRMNNATVENIRALTIMAASVEKMRASAAFNQSISDVFSLGGLEGFQKGFEELGPMFGIMQQNLRNVGITFNDFLEGSNIDQQKVLQATDATLMDLYNKAKKQGANATIWLRTMTNGSITSMAELEKQMMANKKALELLDPSNAISKINSLNQKLGNIGKKERKKVEAEIKELTMNISSSIDSTMADIQASIDNLKQKKESGYIDENEMKTQLDEILKTQMPKIKTTLDLALDQNVKLEGFDKNSFNALNELLKKSVSDPSKLPDAMASLEKMMEKSAEVNKGKTTELIDITTDNVLDEAKKAQNQTQLAMLGLQLVMQKQIAKFTKATYLYFLYGPIAKFIGKRLLSTETGRKITEKAGEVLLPKIWTWLGTFVGWIARLGKSLLLVLPFIKSIVLSFTSLLTLPILALVGAFVLAATGIAAVIQMIVNLFKGGTGENFISKLLKKWTWFQNGLNAIFDWIVNLPLKKLFVNILKFGTPMGWLFMLIQLGIKGFKLFASTLKKLDIMDIVNKSFDWLMKNLFKFLGITFLIGLATKAFDLLKDALKSITTNKLIQSVSKIISKVKNSIVDFVNSLIEIGKKLEELLLNNMIVRGAKGVANWIGIGSDDESLEKSGAISSVIPTVGESQVPVVLSGNTQLAQAATNINVQGGDSTKTNDILYELLQETKNQKPQKQVKQIETSHPGATGAYSSGTAAGARRSGFGNNNSGPDYADGAGLS